MSFKASLGDFRSLCVYSFSHFAVDFSCAFLLFRLTTLNVFSQENEILAFLLYNCLAFGLDFLIGLAVNACTARLSAVVGGMLLVVSLFVGMYISDSVLVTRGVLDATPDVVESLGLTAERESIGVYSLIACVLAGVGNAFFHVGGGIDSLTRNHGKFWRPGVFISTGALGLALGIQVGRNSFVEYDFYLVILTMCVSSFGVWLCCGYHDTEGENAEDRLGNTKTAYQSSIAVLAVWALLFVVFSRSVIGFLAPDLWNVKNALTFSGLALAFAAFLGKFVGGFCADIFGPRTSGFLSTILAIPFLCFCSKPELFWTGVFLLNMSTAITLTCVAQNCKQYVGFAFGLTTIALLAGYFTYEKASEYLVEYELQNRLNLMMIGVLVSSGLLMLFSAKAKK